jgi:hypothetical protein
MRVRRLVPAVPVVAVAAFVVGVVGCGAVGTKAPRVIAPNEDVGACPSGDSVLVNLKAELSAGTFDSFRPTIERVLVDDGGLRTTLALVGAVLPELQGDEAAVLAQTLASDDGQETVDALLPHIINVLDYIHGTSAFIPGKHPEPLVATHNILTQCDAPEQLATLREVLALDVKRAPPGSEVAFVIAPAGEGDSSFLFALVTAVDQAADLPVMTDLLENIEFDDEEGGAGVQVGRGAFIAIAKLLAANISAPDFDLAPTRAILDDVLLPRLAGDPAAEAVLDDLLDLMGILVTNDTATFEGMQAFMGCVDRHDADAAIPGMLFDYLTIDELPLADLLDDVVEAGSAESNTALRLAIISLLDAALRHPDLVGDNTAVVAAFLDPAVADDAVGTLLSLQGKGILDELFVFIDTLFTCKGIAP